MPQTRRHGGKTCVKKNGKTYTAKVFCYPGDKVEKEFMYEGKANSKYAYNADEGRVRSVRNESSKRPSSKTKSEVLDKYSWWNETLPPLKPRKQRSWGDYWSWWRPRGRSKGTRRSRN
jgi:hypothetical protein